MRLTVELTEAEASRLREAADRLGLDPADLARAAISDLVSVSDEEFRAIAERIVQKNEELYRRLA